MKYIVLALSLFLSTAAKAEGPWFFGSGEAVNLTNGIAYKNGVKNIAGPLNPSSTAVNAPSGSMYYSTSGTIYVKQDAGLTTNWLPLGIATTGSLTTINGQSGPNINVVAGTSGSNFAVSTASNILTLNLPDASAIARGALSSGDWTLFNSKEPGITAGTSSQIWQGDKTWIAKTSLPISTATQTALDLKQDAATAATDSELTSGLATKENSIAAGTSAQVWQGDKTWVNKADLPVSTATQTALDLKQDAATAATDSELTAGLATKEPAFTTLPLVKGGTNKALTAVNGGVVYTDADSQEVSAAGTSGQVLQSNGAAAPTWVNKAISGKAQNKAAVSVQEIQIPNNALTLVTGNKYLAETGNKNILDDASFEGSNASSVWSLTVGSYISDNSPIDGVFNAQLSMSGQSLFFAQDSTLYASEFADGVQGLAMVRVRTGVTSTPIYVCSRQAGTTGSLTSGCVQVQSNNKWGLYKVPFILGGASNGIAITSNGVAFTGDVEVDDAFVGAVDLKQDINVVGPWTNGTCVSSHTTNTTTTCKYRQVGDSIEVQERNLYSGAPNAASLTFGIPSGFTVNTSKLSTTSAAVNQLGIGTALDSGVSFYQMAIVYGSSTSVSALAQTASGSYVQNGAASNTIPFSFGASDEAQATFIVPVNELNGASSVYSASCGANCVDEFTASISSAGVITNENVDWINGNCSVASGTEYTCNYISTLGLTTGMVCVAVDTSSTTTPQATRIYTSSTTQFVGSAVSGRSWNVSCRKTGTDFSATRTIIGTFNEVMTTPGVTKPKTCYYSFGGASATLASPTVCSTGTCSEVYDSCGTASPPTFFSSAGNYTDLTFASGTFANSSPVFCSCNGYSTSNATLTCYSLFYSSDQTWASNASGGMVLNFFTGNVSGTGTNSHVNVKCEGQAP